MRFFHLFIIFQFSCLAIFAQKNIKITGEVNDEDGNPIEFANIVIKETNLGTTSNEKGSYTINILVEKKVEILCSFIGYNTASTILKIDEVSGNFHELNFILEKTNKQLQEVKIFDTEHRKTNLIRINPRLVNIIPDVSGNIEALIKTMPGVASNNELSTQYRVRGGNFDENLVYVNDILIYRPFLIRSGQQEGLSFVNPDMVSSVLFSAGGFEAKYGDKMSSVLDIRYKKPVENEGSVSLSLLGGSAHWSGTSKNHRFTHISGFRYKSAQYLLNSLETEGEYDPKFIDFQTYLTYDISDELEISFLGNLSQNEYTFVPENRETSFGTVNEALQLRIYFEGQEVDKFTTYTAAIASEYKPSKDLKLKFIASTFETIEEETYDIYSQYRLNELDRNLGSDTYGDSIANIGIGSYLNHARNYLNVNVFNIAHKGEWTLKNNEFKWGLDYQFDVIDDNLNEWILIDSSGYSLPYTDSIVNVFDYIIADNYLETSRTSLYGQDTYTLLIDSAEFSVTGGLRLNYWNFNNQFLVSPRLSMSLRPNWDRDVLFRFATGYYYQQPFYKELRDSRGVVNANIKAQESLHVVLGMDYQFFGWNRPFKFVSEIYYKHMENLIPYDVDNVRIRYHGENSATGYAMGIDLKINGEFVKGVDSWASLSVMQTEEDIEDDFYTSVDSLGQEHIVFPGYIPRPSDQRINFAIFFQDYLPRNPSYKMHLNLLFGSGLPFGPPNSERYLAVNRMPSYRRVDIGFSKEISGAKSKSNFVSTYFKSIWITAEIFNLLGVNNTISHIWVTDISNRQYAVPNSLTSRRLNLKIIAKF
jgi:CarboxypepD_reg-like domain/TonB-dependent Receptor Plug Domain